MPEFASPVCRRKLIVEVVRAEVIRATRTRCLPEPSRAPERDPAACQQHQHGCRKCRCPAQMHVHARWSGDGGQNNKNCGGACNQNAVDKSSALPPSFELPALHAGANVSVFDAVSLAFSLRRISPRRMLALAG